MSIKIQPDWWMIRPCRWTFFFLDAILPVHKKKWGNAHKHEIRERRGETHTHIKMVCCWERGERERKRCNTRRSLVVVVVEMGNICPFSHRLRDPHCGVKEIGAAQWPGVQRFFFSPLLQRFNQEKGKRRDSAAVRLASARASGRDEIRTRTDVVLREMRDARGGQGSRGKKAEKQNTHTINLSRVNKRGGNCTGRRLSRWRRRCVQTVAIFTPPTWLIIDPQPRARRR